MIKSIYHDHPDDFIQEEINEHDKELVRKADSLDWTDWMLIDANAAETVEGYKKLHYRASYLAHKEEAMNGNL